MAEQICFKLIAYSRTNNPFLPTQLSYVEVWHKHLPNLKFLLITSSKANRCISCATDEEIYFSVKCPSLLVYQRNKVDMQIECIVRFGGWILYYHINELPTVQVFNYPISCKKWKMTAIWPQSQFEMSPLVNKPSDHPSIHSCGVFCHETPINILTWTTLSDLEIERINILVTITET